jgi:uncharacterized protein YrzB (UPF0473 family)
LKSAIISSLFFILAFSSCDKSELPTECSPEVMCTTEFSRITLQVKDQNGNPVLLDKLVSVKSNTGEQILVDDLKNESSIKQGDYIVWSDLQKDKTSRDGESIQVLGYKDGIELVNQNYKIGRDCCHIEKKDGSSELVVSVNAK